MLENGILVAKQSVTLQPIITYFLNLLSYPQAFQEGGKNRRVDSRPISVYPNVSILEDNEIDALIGPNLSQKSIHR